MSPIDLRTFATYSTKIPAQLLRPEEQKPKTHKIFFSQFIDGAAIMGLTLAVNGLMQIGLGQHMTSPTLQKLWMQTPNTFAITFIPMLMSYYFFSFFFNHGQTYGMSKMNLRVAIPMHDFKKSFEMIFKLRSQSFKPHDHLYQELTEWKEMKVAPLVDQLSESENVVWFDEKMAA